MYKGATVKLLMRYQDVFDDEPSDRLSYISSFSKVDLLLILATINASPKWNRVLHSLSEEDELSLVHFICGQDNIDFAKRLVDVYLKIRYTKGVSPGLLLRPAIIFSINEILSTPELNTTSTSIIDIVEFFKYYLLVLTHLSEFNEDSVNRADVRFQDIFPITASINETLFPFTGFFELIRGVELAAYIEKNDRYSQHFLQFMADNGFSGTGYFDFLVRIWLKIQRSGELIPPKFKPESSVELRLYKSLSKRTSLDAHPLDHVQLKQSAFFDCEDDSFILLDIPFLIDRCYFILINKFWFECLKPLKFDHREYFGFIGLFFEQYVSKILQTAMSHLKHPKPKFLDDLLISSPDGDIELSDLYVRDKKKILIGDIKSSQLTPDSKYAEDNIDTIRSKIRDLGVLKVAEQVCRFIDAPMSFDEKIKVGSNYKIYPVIILQDRFYHNLHGHDLFQEVFRCELSKLKDFDSNGSIRQSIHFDRYIIKPITILHITDLEFLAPWLSAKKSDIFSIIDNRLTSKSFSLPVYHLLPSKVFTEKTDAHKERLRSILLQ
jgi:hypothetical protein